jgi:hypothetical protein
LKSWDIHIVKRNLLIMPLQRSVLYYELGTDEVKREGGRESERVSERMSIRERENSTALDLGG